MRGKPQKDSNEVESFSPRTVLLRAREGVLAALVALSSDRAQAERYLDEFRQIEQQLGSSLPIKASGRFAKYSTAAFAFEAYLLEVGHPVEREHAIAEILAGGFAPTQATNPAKSLRQSASSTGRLTKRVVEIDGQVGLPAWVGKKGTFDESLYRKR
jgi:hypothetical protein